MTSRIAIPVSLALVGILAACRGLLYVNAEGDLTHGILFTLSLSADDMRPLNVERVRVVRFERDASSETIWNAAGSSRLGSLRYGELADGLSNTIGPLKIASPGAYRVEAVGSSPRRPLMAGSRYFVIEESGSVKACDACNRCPELDGITEFGPCTD